MDLSTLRRQWSALTPELKRQCFPSRSFFKATNEDNLAAYYYNEKTGKWDKIGGKVDKKTKQVSCQVSHLSKYALMEDIAPPAEVKTSFPDLPANHWAREAIEFMAGKGIIKGYENGTCRPDNPVTRAEFTTFLVRALNLQDVKGAATSFTDVKPGDWCYQIISSACHHNLIKGYSTEKFALDDQVTREQVAAMILRALAFKGVTVESLNESKIAEILGPFNDQQKIYAWAKAGMAGAIRQNIMKGYPDGSIKPQNAATCAQSAAMLKKIL
ncbi:MAG TPA: hypothetical protein DD719_05480 [Desulfotomaculum sp.]|nr:hypothetical protein [Desulfotomaculum sp.]